MTEAESDDELASENDALRRRNDRLARRVADAEQSIAAFARGEIDAVTDAASASPVLLHAAQEELRRSTHLMRAIFDGALDAMLLADDDGKYVDANPAACELFGLARAELIGRRIADFATPGYDSEATFRAFRERGQMRAPFVLNRPDGTRRTLDGSAVANVAPGLHLSVLRDVTARDEAERALVESRDLLEEAQAIAHVGSWSSTIGAEGHLDWSRECYRIFGIAEGTPMTVQSFFALVHEVDRDDVRRASREAEENDAPYDIEHRVQRPDGTVRWVRERAVIEHDATGRPVRMLGTVQDVTDRRAVTDAMQRSEQRYRRIVEGTQEGVWLCDAAGVTTFMSARMAEMLGYTVEETLGQPIFAFLPEVARADTEARLDRGRRGVRERVLIDLRCKDGSLLSVSAQSNPLFDDADRFEGVLSLITDVTAARVAEETRANLAAIVESSEDAILGVSLDGVITSWNRAAEKLYQYTAEEMTGQSIFRLVPPATVEEERLIIARAMRGDATRTYESERRRKDGSLVEVSVTVSPIRDAAGTVIGLSKIARDLTPRRKAEAAHRRTEDQLRQAQKMEAVGRLAGGVAHDFNNVLSVILSYTELAIEGLEAGDPLRDDLVEVHKAGQRATDLTRQLLAFSRQQVLQPRVLDLNQSVVGMEKMLRRLLGEDIEVTLQMNAALGSVLADPGQIEQVMMNLAVNARDAMPEGGELTIETANVQLDASEIVGVAPGDYVMLAVSDTGIGMDAATRARIFEPFFTTKGQGKGTGLGLATVFGIVEQSGGHVGVHSEPGGGSTFKVYLPRTGNAVHAPSSAAPAAILRGSETILLVEDEDQVRAVACSILRRNGYNVLEASNGGEALLLSRDFPSAINLLLTDVVMPRMNGRKLAEELAPQRPEMRVLFASGYTDDAIVHHGVRDAGLAFLQKPFTPETLLRKVREVLDGPDPARADRSRERGA